MLVKVEDKRAEIPAYDGVDGEDHDVNPTTGNVVEPLVRLPGGRVIYSDDLRRGGDGRTWARTSKQAVSGDRSRGIDPKWPTRSARVNRTTFVPSDSYSGRYEEIFGHG